MKYEIDYQPYGNESGYDPGNIQMDSETAKKAAHVRGKLVLAGLLNRH